MKFSPPYNLQIKHNLRQSLRPPVVRDVLKGKALVVSCNDRTGCSVGSSSHHRHPNLTVVFQSALAISPRPQPKAIILSMKHLFAFALMTLLSAGTAAAQQPAKPEKEKTQDSGANCTMHDDHSKMNERAEKGMGFSQTATTHHFLLRSNGGVIQVEANDPKDTVARDEIRAHLRHISHAFSEGEFNIPMFVHDTVPPGAADMKRLSKQITYTFQEAPSGGRVVIATSDPDALAAIHKFLRFQIDEHQTHDPTVIK